MSYSRGSRLTKLRGGSPAAAMQQEKSVRLLLVLLLTTTMNALAVATVVVARPETAVDGHVDNTATPPRSAGRLARLGFWTSVPVCSGGICATTTDCLERTVDLVQAHHDVIDRLIVGNGLTVTVSGQLVCADCGKLHPLAANLASWLPKVRAALGDNSELIASLSIGFDAAAHRYNTTVQSLRSILSNADALVANLTTLAVAHGFDGYDVDIEAECCNPSSAPCGCDDEFSELLAALFSKLSASLRVHNKTLSMDVNEHGSRYLTMPYYDRYLAAGVSRLRQMGTYGLSNTSEITAALLRDWPIDRIGFGTCTLTRYGQNLSTVRTWLQQLAKSSAAAAAIASNTPIEVDVFMLQAGTQREDRTGAQPGTAQSPPADWWELLRHFRSGGLADD